MIQNKETEEKLSRLQLLEQSRQTINVQKQNFQMRLLEIESALKELEKSDEVYKIIGNIMLSSNKEELKKELENEKNMLNLRIDSMNKQEETIREKMKKLQNEIMAKK
ncbi:prefoldin subunit beta [Candidatus Woesearchaeota archaeon ex4484_78]|nr:MAG: prefoldin subunit beta [Candidatus Woesearchaeota archaeon ex4484_78]